MRYRRCCEALAALLVFGRTQLARAAPMGEPAYIMPTETSAQLSLVTAEGRWSFSPAATDCTLPMVPVQVRIEPVDVGAPLLLLTDGEACHLGQAQFVDPTPCNTDANGQCDVDMEPRS
jgi:hypothetical protein